MEDDLVDGSPITLIPMTPHARSTCAVRVTLQGQRAAGPVCSRVCLPGMHASRTGRAGARSSVPDRPALAGEPRDALRPGRLPQGAAIGHRADCGDRRLGRVHRRAPHRRPDPPTPPASVPATHSAPGCNSPSTSCTSPPRHRRRRRRPRPTKPRSRRVRQAARRARQTCGVKAPLMRLSVKRTTIVPLCYLCGRVDRRLLARSGAPRNRLVRADTSSDLPARSLHALGGTV